MAFQDLIGHSGPITWLRHALQSHQLAHAYLFIGENAIGKRQTALQFIQAMNCERSSDSKTPDACGQCRTCQQILDNIHPDVLFIQPDEGQGQHPQIKIEQVREIEQHVIYRPLIGLRKICIIDQADEMTIGAANALLKTLEEPPDHCLFILITSRPSALLATIQSRCLNVRFSAPAQDLVVNYLIQQRQYSSSDARLVSFLTHGRIGEALHINLEEAKAKQEEFFALLFDHSSHSITHGFEVAEALSKSEQIQEALTWLSSGLRDLLLVAVQSSSELLFNQDKYGRLLEISKLTTPRRILSLLDELHQLELGLQRNLNMQLGLERFMIHLHEAISTSSG